MAKTKMLRARVSQAEYLDHEDSMDGFCTACGEWTCGGCEPDARKYECDSCGAKAVYGAQEILMMGLIDLTEDDPEDD